MIKLYKTKHSCYAVVTLPFDNTFLVFIKIFSLLNRQRTIDSTRLALRACCRTVKLGCHGPFRDIKNSQFSHGLDHDCPALELCNMLAEAGGLSSRAKFLSA